MPRASHRTFGLWMVLAVLLAIAIAAFAGLGRSPRRPTAARSPAAPRTTNLTFAEYAIGADAVVDGDTLKMPDGIRVRVRGLDTEEVFRRTRDRRDAERDFAAYARRLRGSSAHPVKFGTPAGEAASLEARRLLAPGTRVRLEVDDPDEFPEDSFGRHLLHVVLVGSAGERSFAEEMIRGGHSPYYVKYGRVLRYHEQLAGAEADARRLERGIWGTDGPDHYPDYPERLEWWHARARQVERWRAAGEAPDRISLNRKDAEARLDALIGKQGTVFGVVRARKDEGRPHILWLRHRRRNDFPVVVFEEAVWSALDPAELDRWFLRVTGRVTLYRGEPQIVVSDAAQISID